MPRDGKPTRDKILKYSKELVLERGFSGMSIDMIIERAEVSKGTFLYHFRTKNDLARALMDEYIKHDDKDRNDALKAVKNIEDPLNRFIEFIQVFIDEFDKLKTPFSGCLYASYSYESVHFNDEIIRDIANAFHRWQHTVEEMINEISKQYEPTMNLDAKALAYQLSTVFEGAFIVSKAVNDASLTARQLEQYQNYIKLLFKN